MSRLSSCFWMPCIEGCSLVAPLFLVVPDAQYAFIGKRRQEILGTTRNNGESASPMPRPCFSRMITSFIMRDMRGREGGMTPPDQLPAIIEPGALTPLPDTHLVPALIAAAGE